MRRALVLAVVAAALALASTAAAFVPTDPLAAKQWYLADDHAFDIWPTPPTYQPVRPMRRVRASAAERRKMCLRGMRGLFGFAGGGCPVRVTAMLVMARAY